MSEVDAMYFPNPLLNGADGLTSKGPHKKVLQRV